jgi:hypothetical protein
LIETVEHAVAVAVERTAHGVDLRPGRGGGALVEPVGDAVAVGVGRCAQSPGVAQQRLDVGQAGIGQAGVAERLVGAHFPAEGVIGADFPRLADPDRGHRTGEVGAGVGLDVHQAEAAGKKPVVALLLGKQPLETAAQGGDVGVADAGAVAVVVAPDQVAKQVEVLVQALAVTQAKQGD